MSTTTQDLVIVARKQIAAAQRKAKKIAGDPKLERSTRARHALKVRADALEQVAQTLAGK